MTDVNETNAVEAHRRNRGGGIRKLAAVSAIAVHGLAGATNASVTNNWITWDAPASDSYQYVAFNGFGQAGYDYTTTATGTLTMADSSTVYVRLTGEVVRPDTYGDPTTGPYYGPSGFSDNGTTVSNYWSQLLGSGTSAGSPNDGSAFLSDNITSLPSNGDHIGLIGAGATTQTIEFFSDAGFSNPVAVQNLLILVQSLGNSGTPASWTFNRDFDILSDNAGTGSGGLTKTNPSAGDYVLGGSEGHGAIQFTGVFTSFSWTVSAAEAWASWNLGGTNVPAPSAVPGAGLAGLATLGLAGVARRRRR